MAVAGSVLVSTAWHGGEVVYRYGIGVMSLPNVEEGADGHNHSHNTAPKAGSEYQPVSSNISTQHDDHSHSANDVKLIEPSKAADDTHSDHATTTVTEIVGEKGHTSDHDNAH